MKKELQNKLSRYTAAAAAIVAASGANAQIVYTDPQDVSVDDDADANGFSVVGLDLNNDMTFDFIVAARDTTVGGSRIRFTVAAPYGTASAIAGETPSAYDYALALNSGDMIDNTLNWIAATNTMAYNVDSANPYNENWNGVTDKYLGLQFTVGGNTHYGWARLDVQAIGDVFTLKDYAFNASPDQGIEAGQTAGLLMEQMESMVHFVNQSDNTVKVVISSALTGGKISVVSASGAVVSSSAVESESFIVDMNGLAAGIYVISAEFNEGAMTKKMIVH
ncbi:MAG: T9SS type A sorting domain-containing protein [Bacteroidota bacterium]|jgi:hypothetical protein